MFGASQSRAARTCGFAGGGEGANRHSQKNNANERTFHRKVARGIEAQCRAASLHRAKTSASVSTRADRFAASKMRFTTESSAGMPCFFSQKSTLDLPLMGPISIT